MLCSWEGQEGNHPGQDAKNESKNAAIKISRASRSTMQSKTSDKIVNLHCLFYNSGLFKEIFRDSRPHHSSSWRKHHFQIFSKTAGVVIDGGARISKGFHQRVDLQNFLSQGLIVGLCQTESSHKEPPETRMQHISQAPFPAHRIHVIDTLGKNSIWGN